MVIVGVCVESRLWNVLQMEGVWAKVARSWGGAGERVVVWSLVQQGGRVALKCRGQGEIVSPLPVRPDALASSTRAHVVARISFTAVPFFLVARKSHFDGHK